MEMRAGEVCVICTLKRKMDVERRMRKIVTMEDSR